MRFRRRVSGVLAVSAILGVAATIAAPAVAGPQTENVYVDGQTYAINTSARVILNANPHLLQRSVPMYQIGFGILPGTTGPITLPSGYQPQNNGLPPVLYHDHVLTGAPGLGTSGTARAYKAPHRVIVMRYTTAYTYDPAFVPVTSFDQIAAAEAAGKFQLINPGATDPYQIPTPTVLIRPIIRFHR